MLAAARRGGLGVLGFLGFAASSALVHSVVRSHYLDVCTPSWLAGIVGLADSSPYCQLVHRGLSCLQLSTALASVACFAPRAFLRDDGAA
jgi:hypothetical protein